MRQTTIAGGSGHFVAKTNMARLLASLAVAAKSSCVSTALNERRSVCGIVNLAPALASLGNVCRK